MATDALELDEEDVYDERLRYKVHFSSDFFTFFIINEIY